MLHKNVAYYDNAADKCNIYIANVHFFKAASTYKKLKRGRQEGRKLEGKLSLSHAS